MQRFAQAGWGAYCGNIRASINQAGTCAPALNGDLVVASNDLGHQGGMGGPGASGQPEGAFGADPQKRIDFAYRANYVTALASKALIQAFYGQPQKYAYFVGCSDGGREALIEAQRFPNDFDGIAAGAPVAIINVHNSLFHSWTSAANKRADGSTILYRERVGILQSAVAAHCPTLSGIDDGILANPLACKFDPGWVQCDAGNADTSACLTAEEVAVVKKIYDGPQDASGRLFEISGLPLGSEKQWNLPGRTPGGPGGPGGGGRGGGGMAGGSIKYLLLPTVSPDSAEEIMAKFTFTQEWFDRVREIGYLYNAANTNLRAFADHGGSLIVWHGGADTSVPPAISVAYYQGVQKELGEKQTDTFIRFFLLPGVGHCGGGDGPSQLDVLTPLIAWTEQKHAPEKIVVGKPSGGSGMKRGFRQRNSVAGRRDRRHGAHADLESRVSHRGRSRLAVCTEEVEGGTMSKLSRRDFLATTTGAIFAPGSVRHALADTLDPRVAKVVAETMGIDMHNHVYPAGTQQGPQRGGDPGPTLSLGEELKLSGLTAISAGFALDRAGNTKPGDARVNFLKWLDAIDAELEKGHVSRALTLEDLRTAHARGQKAIVQTVEGAHFIEGHVERIEEVYKRGLRHLQLLHDSNDMVAPLGDINGGTSLGGLTPMGADVIKECNRLKILVDMAHGSSATLLAALKFAKQPIIVSHSSLDVWTNPDSRMASRSIAKQDAKALADAGGVLGVWTKGTNNPGEFVRNIKMVADAIGVDHVGIGTDDDILSPRPGTGLNRAWQGMTGGFFPVVVEEFLRQGFTPVEIAKISGGNFGRVFGAVVG